MSEFLSKKYCKLLPYIPGEQPKEGEFVKLNTNESPFPPSRKVIEAINEKEVKKLALYSDPDSTECTEAVARYYGLKKNQVLLTNGSDEALAFIYAAFCDGEKEIVAPEISYGFYPVLCGLLSLKYNFIPLKNDYKIDVDAFCGINRNIIIANPNAPTGIALPLSEIEKILKSNPRNVVIVDEAYVDFGAESTVGLIDEYCNLIVVRTFSKSRSLAGARLGTVLSNEGIIADLKKIKFSFNPYNVNRLTEIAGKRAVEDVDYFEFCRGEIIKNREFLTKELEKRGFYVLPSSANFVFARCGGVSGKKMYLKLKEKGVLVRHFDDIKICDFNRISVGSSKQIRILLQKIDEILSEEETE